MTAVDTREDAGHVAAAVADWLATPNQARALLKPEQGWWPQSLAHGAAGVALLHIERARTGCGPWQRAHEWLAAAARDGEERGPGAHLHYGAPALAFALNTAAQAGAGYAGALERLDTAVADLGRRRLQDAHARMGPGDYRRWPSSTPSAD